MRNGYRQKREVLTALGAVNVTAPRITADDDLDVTFGALACDICELCEKGSGVTGLGILTSRFPQNEHGQLGEVVFGHVDAATVDKAARGAQAIPVDDETGVGRIPG